MADKYANKWKWCHVWKPLITFNQNWEIKYCIDKE